MKEATRSKLARKGGITQRGGNIDILPSFWEEKGTDINPPERETGLVEGRRSTFPSGARLGARGKWDLEPKKEVTFWKGASQKVEGLNRGRGR